MALSAPLLLLVEDSSDDIRVSLRALSRHFPDLVVEVARDGLEALDALGLDGTPRGRVPDLVVCDLKMPRVAGDELLRRMRADIRLKAVPFVVFSSSAEPSDVERCEAGGVSEYASKPISFEAYETRLVEFVMRWLPTVDAP